MRTGFWRKCAGPVADVAISLCAASAVRGAQAWYEDFESAEAQAKKQNLPLLVHFHATWCQPCKKEMPGYQKLVDEYGARGFAVIGFKFDTMPDMENPVEFAKKIGVHYPLAVATEDLKQKFGGIEGLPTTMLYDRNGVLRTKVIGFEYTDNIESAMKPLL